MLDNVIVRADRTFIALHKAGRISRGRSRVYHAVTPHCRIALCSDEPGASSGWAEPPGNGVTCPACLKAATPLGGVSPATDRRGANGSPPLGFYDQH